MSEQCDVCGCWDGDGDWPDVNDVSRYPVTIITVDNVEREADERESTMALCQDCVQVDPIRDDVDVFGVETRVYLA